MKKKVFVSGCYDLLHSGHVEFFQQASQYGDLYVGIGSDATYLEYKHRKPMFPQEERLFMVKNIKAVKEAYINEGSGVIDFLPTLDKVKPDVFVVNAEGGSDEKRRICKERGIEYVELQRTPHAGLKARSSSGLKKALLNVSENSAQEAGIPTRLDLAGTWIDQPYVSMYHPGWAITISLEPTFEVRDRCGLSTSTRKMIQKIWPVKLPKMDPEMLARLVFCFENNPEQKIFCFLAHLFPGSFIRCVFIWKKISLLMAAHRTYRWGLLSVMDITAVCTDPPTLFFPAVIGAVFQHFCDFLKSLLMSMLNFCNLEECRRRLKKTFCLCRTSKRRIHIFKFFLFIMLRCSKKLF